jgi:hypothetical protein
MTAPPTSVVERPTDRASTESRTWLRTAARLGIGARGVIYVVFAYLAFDIARHGSAPAQADSTGALAEVGHRSGGPALLVVLAVGLACYAGWRLIDAVSGNGGVFRRLGSLGIAVVYIGLMVRAVQLAAGRATGGNASTNPAPTVARVMSWSGGTEVVGVVGAVLVVSGVGLAVWGLAHRYSRSLALERVDRTWRRVIRTLGALGNAARGFLVALVGGFLLDTAVTADPARAKGVDQALQDLVHHSYGALLIGVVALGLLCFGAYSFAEARLRKL